jgi:hypothetical protein
MRKNHSILSCFTAAVFLAMILVLSCSHTENSENGDEAQVSEGGGDKEASASDNPDQAVAQEGEEAVPAEGSGDTAESKPPSDEALSELESTVSDGKLNPENAPATEETPVASTEAPAAEAPVAEQAPLAEQSATQLADASMPPVAEPPPETKAPDAPALEQQSAPLDMSSAPPATPEMEKPPEAKIPPITIPSDAPKKTAKHKAPHRAKHASHKGGTKSASAHTGGKALEAPRIPGRAFAKKGVNLNRFYFLRKGDTPKTLAQLVYGDISKSKDLTAWNGSKGWKAGLLVYYTSPIEAQDSKMQAFYQERNVPVEEYTVEASDTLFTIASAKLGDKGSWTEIAAVNGMETSNGIQPGQKLALYPADLSGFTLEKAKPVVAQNAPVQQPANNPPPQNVTPPPAEPPPSMEPPKVVPIPKPTSTGLDIAELVQQNIFAVGIGGVILILLIGLMALNRKKKGKGEDFADENFNPPRARRK